MKRSHKLQPDLPIVVNLSRIGERGTGLATYARELLSCLETRFTDFRIVAPPNSCLADAFGHHEVSGVPDWLAITQDVSRLKPLLWLLHSYIAFPKRGIVISPTHHAVPGAHRQIITIHDLRPYFLPDSFLQKFYFRHYLPRALKGVSGVLTVSQATKDLIVKHYGFPSERIHVVNNVVNTQRFLPASRNVERSYLLMVGANWHHKNAQEFLQMHGLWAQRYTAKIVVGNGAYRHYLSQLCRELNLLDKVELIGYVAFDRLLTLYHGAKALIYPSMMEGFGIPPLEAIACEIPIIVSDIPVFREVYEDAAIYVQLGDSESWRYAFSQIEQACETEMRLALGKARLNRFTRENMCASLDIALRAIFSAS